MSRELTERKCGSSKADRCQWRHLGQYYIKETLYSTGLGIYYCHHLKGKNNKSANHLLGKYRKLACQQGGKDRERACICNYAGSDVVSTCHGKQSATSTPHCTNNSPQRWMGKGVWRTWGEVMGARRE
ncbi:hypothetical protein AMECASPLE_025059 [Ameca splendens]|uniref:Uncharacterized protein n=1 Tax=Ameca splendens TaxID=208324 RepID=A0ABV0Z2I2_9TELE